MNCSAEKYPKNGVCCDRCPAGKYVQEHCNATKSTVCGECKEGQYTATTNSLHRCQICTVCSSANNQITLQNCTAKKNTECGCSTDFYCKNDDCDHCQAVTECPKGKGVEIQATRTNDTVCVTCKDGTYSNASSPVSPCIPHTRCEDLGKALETAGTSETDAVCGDFLHTKCPWMLPAGLWAGLVVTALILFAAVIYRRAKRNSYRSRSSSIPVTLVEVAPAASVKSLDLPLPVTSLDFSLSPIKENGHCQESCAVEDFKLPLFNQDDNLANCSMDSSLPITPLKASVSFAEPDYINKSAGYGHGNFLRTYSEPQEDEWCGT